MLTRDRATAPARSARLRRGDPEAGIGIIMVIGVTATLLLIMTVSVVVATNSLSSSRQHVFYETSLSAAETGMWARLADVQAAASTGPTYTYSSTCTPNTPVNVAAERTWAQEQIARMVDTITGCTVGKAGEGEYFAFTTTNAAGQRVVYSQGWAPGRSASGESKSRIVKMTFELGGYKPNFAVLGNTAIDMTAAGISVIRAGDNSAASVHANGNATGSLGLAVQGRFEATGTNNLAANCPQTVSGGCQQAAIREPFPALDARTIYRSLAPQFTSRWYTLCSDATGGYVYRPPVGFDPLLTPCPSRGSANTQTTVDGWTYASATTRWTYNGSGSPGSIYYIFGANADINFSGTKSLMVLVGATSPATGTGVGGNLTWTSGEVTSPINGLVMYADGTFTTVDAPVVNNVATIRVIGRNGVFGSGGAMTIGTWGQLTGSLLSGGNLTVGANSRVSYDNTTSLPVRSVVRTVQWDELTGP